MLKRRDRDQHGLGSKPTCSILLCPWKRNLMTLSFVWWSGQAVLNFGYIFIKLKDRRKNFNLTAISCISRKKAGIINCPMYSTFIAFRRRRINIEIKRHFTAHSPAWWSWQAVLNYSHISINLQSDSNILVSQEAGRGNCLPCISASVAFLRVRRINIEIK